MSSGLKKKKRERNQRSYNGTFLINSNVKFHGNLFLSVFNLIFKSRFLVYVLSVLDLLKN